MFLPWMWLHDTLYLERDPLSTLLLQDSFFRFGQLDLDSWEERTCMNIKISAVITLHLPAHKHMPCFKLCLNSCINLSVCTHLLWVHHPGTLTPSKAIHFSWSPDGDGACPRVQLGNYRENLQHFVVRTHIKRNHMDLNLTKCCFLLFYFLLLPLISVLYPKLHGNYLSWGAKHHCHYPSVSPFEGTGAYSRCHIGPKAGYTVDRLPV